VEPLSYTGGVQLHTAVQQQGPGRLPFPTQMDSRRLCMVLWSELIGPVVAVVPVMSVVHGGDSTAAPVGPVVAVVLVVAMAPVGAVVPVGEVVPVGAGVVPVLAPGSGTSASSG
jgi:hypothetical protein